MRTDIIAVVKHEYVVTLGIAREACAEAAAVPADGGVRRGAHAVRGLWPRYGCRSDLQAPDAVEPNVWLRGMCARACQVGMPRGVAAVVVAPAWHDCWRGTVGRDIIRLPVKSAAHDTVPPSAFTQHPSAISKDKLLHNFAVFKHQVGTIIYKCTSTDTITSTFHCTQDRLQDFVSI